MKPLEQEIVLRAKSGDGKAIRELLDSIEPAVQSIAHRYSARSGVDADDLANEARIKAVNVLANYDPSKGDFFPFAYQFMIWRVIRVIKHTVGAVRLPCFNWDQGQRPARAISFDDPDVNTPAGQDARIAAFEELREVRIAMRLLPQRHAMILMRRVDGETCEEIGEDLGISRQAVNRIELKAIDTIRKHLRHKQTPPNDSKISEVNR